jgi:hypothetical protein
VDVRGCAWMCVDMRGCGFRGSLSSLGAPSPERRKLERRPDCSHAKTDRKDGMPDTFSPGFPTQNTVSHARWRASQLIPVQPHHQRGRHGRFRLLRQPLEDYLSPGNRHVSRIPENVSGRSTRRSTSPSRQLRQLGSGILSYRSCPPRAGSCLSSCPGVPGPRPPPTILVTWTTSCHHWTASVGTGHDQCCSEACRDSPRQASRRHCGRDTSSNQRERRSAGCSWI